MSRDSTGAPRGPRLLLVGSVLVDLVMPVPALPSRGGDVLAARSSFVVGGGWYVLSAAVGAGLPAAYAGRHGHGPLGDRVRAALRDLGVELLLPPEGAGDSGVCVALVEPDGERTFVTHPGVEARLDAAALDRVVTTATDIVYVSGYDLAYAVSGPAITGWVERRPPGAALVVDPGPLVSDIPAAVLGAVLHRTTVLTLNRREAALLTGQDDPGSVVRDMRRRLASGALVVLRDGAYGADLSGASLGDRLVHVPANPVAAVDTTGAGDVHTGALVAALAAGVEPVAAVRRANAAAARLVAGVWADGIEGGARPGAPVGRGG